MGKLRGGEGINGHEAGVFEAGGDAGDNCGFIGFCAVKEETEVDELQGLALGILEAVKIWRHTGMKRPSFSTPVATASGSIMMSWGSMISKVEEVRCL